MKNCKNCAYFRCYDIYCFCDVNSLEIEHPCLMGGPKRCECYQPIPKVRREPHQYPTKEDLKKYL